MDFLKGLFTELCVLGLTILLIAFFGYLLEMNKSSHDLLLKLRDSKHGTK